MQHSLYTNKKIFRVYTVPTGIDIVCVRVIVFTVCKNLIMQHKFQTMVFICTTVFCSQFAMKPYVIKVMTTSKLSLILHLYKYRQQV